jgi:hypothetical protein
MQIDIKKSRQEHSSFKIMARKFEIGPEIKNDIKSCEGQNISPIKK